MKPIISFSTLDKLEALARLPTKTAPSSKLVEFSEDVSKLKSSTYAERVNSTTLWAGAKEDAWQRIKEAIDAAMEERNFEFLDCFAEIWQKTGRPKTITPFTAGEYFSGNLVSSSDHAPRMPVAVGIIRAIKFFQSENDRAPTRQEINDFYSHLYNRGVGEDVLCKQLKKMKLHALLNKANDLTLAKPISLPAHKHGELGEELCGKILGKDGNVIDIRVTFEQSRGGDGCITKSPLNGIDTEIVTLKIPLEET